MIDLDQIRAALWAQLLRCKRVQMATGLELVRALGLNIDGANQTTVAQVLNLSRYTLSQRRHGR